MKAGLTPLCTQVPSHFSLAASLLRKPICQGPGRCPPHARPAQAVGCVNTCSGAALGTPFPGENERVLALPPNEPVSRASFRHAAGPVSPQAG